MCIFRGCAPRSTRDSPSPCCTPCAARDIWSVTALGKLVRSTAFRLTLVYLLIFALYAAALLVYFALNTGRLITEQITETVDDEIQYLTQQYTASGLRRLILIIENRSLRPGSSLYLITAPTGQGLAGNVGPLAPGA